MSLNDETYAALIPQAMALLEGESSVVAILANVSAVLKQASDWHWVGFYLVDIDRDELALGPFQGPVACTRLRKGKGVCAAAWETSLPQIVANVHEFPGHVACSAATNSELVIPIQSGGRVVAVLDIDALDFDAFSDADVDALRPLTLQIGKSWPQWEA